MFCLLIFSEVSHLNCLFFIFWEIRLLQYSIYKSFILLILKGLAILLKNFNQENICKETILWKTSLYVDAISGLFWMAKHMLGIFYLVLNEIHFFAKFGWNACKTIDGSEKMYTNGDNNMFGWIQTVN